MTENNQKKYVCWEGKDRLLESWILSTVAGIEFKLDEVYLHESDIRREYQFIDEERQIVFRAPMRNVTSCRKMSADPTAGEEAVAAAHNLSPADRDRIFSQAEIESLRFVMRTLGDQTVQIFDTTNRFAAPLVISIECPEWKLKTPPEEYLKRYPDGPKADLARTVVASPMATLTQLMRLANDEWNRRQLQKNGDAPEVRMDVTDMDPDPYMTLPLQAFHELVARGDFKPVMPPVYMRAGATFRPELRDGKILLWRSHIEYSGKIEVEQTNLSVPQAQIDVT